MNLRFRSSPLTSLALGFSLVMAAVSATSARSTQADADWLKTWRATNATWRGVDVLVSDDRNLAALKAVLPKFAAVGVNVIIVEVNYHFEFRSHPELREDRFVTWDAARDLTAAAHAEGIRVIPLLDCLGHQSWSKHTLPLLTKYPQFDETPGVATNNEGIYCRSWCPQNPGVNPVVFSLIDELIDGFQADAFHVGMDEVFLIASPDCPRCRGGDPAKIFAKQVNDLHRHIAGKRKKEMLMWGDRLIDAKAMGYSLWEASTNGTWKAADKIAKDIIVCDWHYGEQSSYPSVPLLLQKGFRVWPSSWQPLKAAVALSDFAREQKNPRMLGLLCTTWGKVKIPDAPEWPPITETLPKWR